MTDWISIDSSTLQDKQVEKKYGVKIVIGLSPFDIPEAVRGDYNARLDRFVIEFKYLGGTEDLVIGFEDKELSLWFGKKSGCLYKIHVDVKQMETESIGVRLMLDVDTALKSLEHKKKYHNRIRHFKAAKAAIKENESELLLNVGT